MADREQVVIAMFDVDYFKAFNDTHGHPAGDRVLKTVAQILKENMRENDIVGRYGGEEFIICFREPGGIENVQRIAERFRKMIEHYHFPGEEKQPNKSITISLGISYPSSSKTLEQLIEEADLALYQAKETGRNRVEISRVKD